MFDPLDLLLTVDYATLCLQSHCIAWLSEFLFSVQYVEESDDIF